MSGPFGYCRSYGNRPRMSGANREVTRRALSWKSDCGSPEQPIIWRALRATRIFASTVKRITVKAIEPRALFGESVPVEYGPAKLGLFSGSRPTIFGWPNGFFTTEMQ